MIDPVRRRRWMQFRVSLMALVLFGAADAVLYRAFEVQVQRGDELRALAEQQHLRDVRLSPTRGTIRDRNGAELAVSVQVDSVWVNPRQLRRNGADPDAVAERLGKLLGVSRKTLRERLASDRYFAWIKRRVTPGQASAVRLLDLRGLYVAAESRRYYPNRELAAQVLGFSNLDGAGIEGIELGLDERLRGAAEQVPALRDRRGTVVFAEGLLGDSAARGDDVTLTIDRTIQHLVEREIELTVRTFEAQAGTVVVVDPRTGEILAMANYPSYNPNAPGREPTHRRNRAITDRYEPGSTMKPFTMAIALDRGAVTEDDRIDCERGAWRVATNVIHDTHRYEVLSPEEILVHSSNIGTAKVSFALGRKGLYDGLRAFGFGERTQVALPGEVAGSLRDPKAWYEIDQATIAFGQGVSTTALGLTMAMAALANEGRLMHPLLIRRVVGRHGEVEEHAPRVRRQAVSVRVARRVSEMLVGVTSEEGTGTEAAIDGYLVAGKTGTAQKADPTHGGYAEGKFSSSFVGYAPADDPRLVVAVVVDEPVIAEYGGVVAAPAFRRIMQASLRHLGVPARAPTNEQARVSPFPRNHRKGEGREVIPKPSSPSAFLFHSPGSAAATEPRPGDG